MKTLLSRWSWIRLVEGILLIILGILVGTIGGTNPEGMRTTLSIIIAVFLFIDALITLFGYVINPEKNFSFECILSAVFIGVGVVLCTPDGQVSLVNLIAVFVISTMVAAALGFLVKGILGIVYKTSALWVAINFLIFVCGGSLGATAIYYYCQPVGEINVIEVIIYIILGIGIVVIGVFDIILAVKGIQAHKACTDLANEVKSKIIEADTYYEDEKNEEPSVCIDVEEHKALEDKDSTPKEIEHKDDNEEVKE